MRAHLLPTTKIKPYHPLPRPASGAGQRWSRCTLKRAVTDQASTSNSTCTNEKEQNQDDVHAAAQSDALAASALQATPASTLSLTLEILRSISSIPAEQWDAVATTAIPAPTQHSSLPDSHSAESNDTNPSTGGSCTTSTADPSTPAAYEINPFVLHPFLLALESSGSVSASQGWAPSHVVVKNAVTHELLGCCPLYIKTHSQGEFVFDQSWANLSHQLGRPYYPKLQSCVPFTPCPGPRLMVRGDLDPPLRKQIIRAMGQSLIRIAESSGMSSVHITFNNAEEWAVLAELGFLQRTGIQFHWDNRCYPDFDAFLGELKQSKRKLIRQERKSIPKQGLQVRVLIGPEIQPCHWDTFYQFYLDTIDRYASYAYLTKEFFHSLGQSLPERVMLVLAEEHDGDDPSSSGPQVVAAALNLIGSHALFGRNWGCSREFRNLHFELCYYQAIDQAIQRGLQRVEAGAQGTHKLQRGYTPSLTYSSHYLLDPTLRHVVSRALKAERAAHLQQLQVLALEASPFKDQAMLELLMQRVQAHLRAVNDSSSDSEP